AGLVAAGLAAAACARAAPYSPSAPAAPAAPADSVGSLPVGASGVDGGGKQRSVPDDRFGFWAELDAEADARTPSPAQRAASRRQGRALLRAARIAWPDDLGLAALAGFGAAAAHANAEYRGGPHHAIVLGAAAAAAGCDPGEAARIA